jgi:hypothetical protein
MNANDLRHRDNLQYRCEAMEAKLDELRTLTRCPADRDLGEWCGEMASKFDMIAHLRRQHEFSERTFGSGPRIKGVVDHIRKETQEVLDGGGELAEWIDVVILALDGAWRSGATPEEIVAALVAKQTRNESRQWPDWRNAPADKAIEHVREAPAAERTKDQ